MLKYLTSRGKTIVVALSMGLIGILVISAIAAIVLLQEQEGQPSTWNPEIPVNEYWDFRTWGDIRLYVNNTDRDVIYALDKETGKIVWTIWGKDYGFDQYEIRLIADRIFISGDSASTDKDIRSVWVFDNTGRLAWKHSFLGYVDMPQLTITPENYVLIESRGGTEMCLKGCGILCEGTKPPEAWCTTHELWAFALETGDVMWVNRTGTLYNVNLGITEDGKISASGGGWGGFTHRYTLDSKTGTTLTHVATLEELEYDQNAKTVSWIKERNIKPIWIVRPGSPIYELVASHADYNGLKLRVMMHTILIQAEQKDGSVQTYAVDAQSGKLLWQQDLDSKQWDIWDTWEYEDSLIIHFTDVSECEDVCDDCAGDSVIRICFGRNIPPACSACKAKERATPGFIAAQTKRINRIDGVVQWTWKSGKEETYVDGSVQEDGTLLFRGSVDEEKETRRVLNLETGIVQ